MIYFTSDTHFLQRPVWNRRVFSSIEEHDDHYFEMYSKTKKKDIIFHLGDFIFEHKDPNEVQKYIEKFKKIPARIKLIPGNHDSKLLYNQNVIEMMPPLVNYKGNWLSHCAIHPGEFRGRFLNVHGHNHIYHLKDQRYFNVCIDMWDRFVTYDEIMERKEKFGPAETDYELHYKKLYT